MGNRYKLFSDKIANMLTPTSQRGRGNILWIQSLLKPLQTLNDTFQSFQKEKTIEANVSSQVLHLTWYLDNKFSQYYQNQGDGIKLLHYVDLGVPIFTPGELGEVPNVIWSMTEDYTAAPASEQPRPLYFQFESINAIGASFKVVVPDITIPNGDFDIMLRAEIERYRISGKTYVIEHT